MTGGVTIYVAGKTREAAERGWVRDSRRVVFDRFLSQGQKLLIACEAANGSSGDDAGVDTAFNEFFGTYGVIQTVADAAVVETGRRYAYLLWELRESLRERGVLPSGEFSSVAKLVRDARHQTIDAMRAALDLHGEARPPDPYNPFEGLQVEREHEQVRAALQQKWVLSGRRRPGGPDEGQVA